MKSLIRQLEIDLKNNPDKWTIRVTGYCIRETKWYREGTNIIVTFAYDRTRDEYWVLYSDGTTHDFEFSWTWSVRIRWATFLHQFRLGWKKHQIEKLEKAEKLKTERNRFRKIKYKKLPLPEQPAKEIDHVHTRWRAE